MIRKLVTLFRLLFAKKYIGVDHGVVGGDYTVETTLKKIGDRWYLTNVKIIDPPQQEPSK